MTVELIIAEKPSVASEIANAIGGFQRKNGYFESPTAIIAFARGHLVQIGMDEAQDPGFNLAGLPAIPAPFMLFASKDSESLLKTIETLAKRSDVTRIVNCCDAGREGELIFRLIMAYLGIKKPIERMWLQTMTSPGIKAAYRDRRSDAQMRQLSDAAISRSEADWLIGINATRALTKSNLFEKDQLVSAGRVQTPVLTLVVDREAAITNFVINEFWEVVGSFGVASGTWKATYQGTGNDAVSKASSESKESETAEDGETTKKREPAIRFNNMAAARQIVLACTDKSVDSTVDTSTPQKRKPPLPFDLTTLQQTCNSQFKLSAQKTLDIAQALYEKHKVTTYPRTDSSHLPEDYPSKVIAVLGLLPARYKSFADEVLASKWVGQKHPVFNNSKISDHFAIIPTGKVPQDLSEAEQKVYDLIVRRFLATFYPSAEFNRTTRISVIGPHVFSVSGSVMVEPGWLKVMPEFAGDDARKKGKAEEAITSLPLIGHSEVTKNIKIELRAGKTKPPPRYSESTLLGAMKTAGKLVDDEAMAEAMKERGLGTQATRAATIEDLLSERKGYLLRKGTQLHPTGKAIELVGTLRKISLHFLTSPDLTGDWESKLAQMEKDNLKRTDFMATVRKTTEDMVAKIKASMVRTDVV